MVYNFEKRKRNWIFTSLLIIGIVVTFMFVIFETNLFYKNGDFTTTVMFESNIEGESGYLSIQRNPLTPSVLEWASFENGEKSIFFSDSLVKEHIFVEVPNIVESGVYYFNVEVNYLSGLKNTKEIKFRIIG